MAFVIPESVKAEKWARCTFGELWSKNFLLASPQRGEGCEKKFKKKFKKNSNFG